MPHYALRIGKLVISVAYRSAKVAFFRGAKGDYPAVVDSPIIRACLFAVTLIATALRSAPALAGNPATVICRPQALPRVVPSKWLARKFSGPCDEQRKHPGS